MTEITRILTTNATMLAGEPHQSERTLTSISRNTNEAVKPSTQPRE